MVDENEETPTIKWGDPGFYEDWLIGNRSGFYTLREKIDELLERESDTPMPENCESDFRGLSIQLDCDPTPENSRSHWFSRFGCLLAFVFLLGLLVLGFLRLIELLVN